MKSRNNLVERKGFIDSVEIREPISKISYIARLKVRFLVRKVNLWYWYWSVFFLFVWWRHRWMGVCKRRLRIVMVPVPTLSGPTSGRVIEEELEEWARQARRWTIGAAEVFHYFMVKSNNIPFFTALSWGITFIIYYGNYLSLFIIIIITFTKFSNLIGYR